MRKVSLGNTDVPGQDNLLQYSRAKTLSEMDQTCHWITQEGFLCTSHRRSLVKISSLARSSWFHSSRSFSCPFQLSLSCSLVLKAVRGQGKKSTHQTPRNKRVRTITYGQLSEPFIKGDSKHVILESDTQSRHFTDSLFSLNLIHILYVPKYVMCINLGDNIFPFHILTVNYDILIFSHRFRFHKFPGPHLTFTIPKAMT